MLRLYCDFNAKSEDTLWILYHDDVSLEDKADALGLRNGMKVILYQDEDDFEVVATLIFRFSDYTGREAWGVIPDYDTLVYFPDRIA